jgi:ABC-type antimicrobial peptide transport system permease subunit
MVDRELLGSLLTFIGVDLAPGADERAALADLRSSLEPEVNMEAVTYRAPVRPAEIVNARSMRAVPLLVGGLLAGAAFVGLAVAVVVSVRGRRRELAILRALGFTARQVRTSVRVQAVATIAAALAVGVPLGIAVGRVAWRAFALRLGVVTDPSTPGWWIVATVVGSLSLGVAVAFFPARLAARINPATALRTE